MQLIRAVSLWVIILASLPLLGQAGDPAPLLANVASNQPLYVVRVEHVGGPGLLPADYAYVTFRTNQFGFVRPDGFRLKPGDGQKVTLVSADLNCLVSFRVLETEPAGDSEPDAAHYRELLLSRHPGGKIVDEFSLAAVSRRGPAFDLRWNAAGAVPRRERVVFIGSAVGVLEFSLVSSLEKFEAGRQAFSTFLLTFRSAEPGGRLIMPVLSDKL
jgi:hypothetical protein